MKRSCLALMIIAFASLSLLHETAEARRRGHGEIYVGGGLFREINTYKIDSNESNFAGWGAAGVVGMEFELSGGIGFMIEGEYTRHEMLNALQSTTYLEKATNTAMIGKAGLFYGVLGIGVGLAKNRIDIDNVQSNSNGIRTSYDGLTYQVFGQLTLPAENKMRTVIEGKYGMGTIGGMTYSELQIGLRLYFMPF